MNLREPLPPVWRKILSEVSMAAALASAEARKAGDKDAETCHAITALCAHKALEKDRAIRAQDN